MKEFLNYMNHIKAEKKLKENTKDYVEININNIDLQNSIKNTNEKMGKGKINLKKFLVAASTVAACTVFAFIGNLYYNNPVEYLSVDINPSVELGINAFNKVISIEGINKDGETLLKEKKYLKMNTEDAVEALVKEAENKGFVAADGSTVIAVTAISNNEGKAVQLKDRAYNRIQQEIKDGKVKAIAYGDYSNLELRAEAQKLNMSSGKYKLVSALKTLDPSINVEEYRNTKITNIIAKANNLLTSNTEEKAQTKEFKRVASMISTAAQKINNISDNKSNTNMNQTQTGTQTQTKTQSGTQTQTQTGTQTQTQTGTQTQTQTGTQTGTQTQTQAGTQTENQTQTETQTQQDDTSQSTSQQNQVKAGGNQN